MRNEEDQALRFVSIEPFSRSWLQYFDGIQPAGIRQPAEHSNEGRRHQSQWPETVSPRAHIACRGMKEIIRYL